MRFTPAEIVAGYCALVGSPCAALLMIESNDDWRMKVIGIASLAGLLLHTVRRLKTEDRG